MFRRKPAPDLIRGDAGSLAALRASQRADKNMRKRESRSTASPRFD
jgi:hypothetical protein